MQTSIDQTCTVHSWFFLLLQGSPSTIVIEAQLDHRYDISSQSYMPHPLKYMVHCSIYLIDKICEKLPFWQSLVVGL